MAPDEKKNKTDEELIDYISRLPESVIHHILSFLTFKRIVRTSVLSKTWNRVWSNYPNVDLMLNFEMYDCPRPRFLRIFERIMDQCLFQKDCIQKLQLDISFPALEELKPFLDQSLGGAIARNVSELVIKIHSWKEGDSPNCMYSIPKEVFTGSLKVLEIERCKFEGCHAGIELPCLQKFTISWCKFFGEDLLNTILCGFPELEFLDVNFCEGVGHCLSVLSKPRLKYFSVCHVKELARVEVFVPSLETFKCFSLYPCAVDLASCTVLKYLELDGADLSTEYVPIQDLLSSKLLCIEELRLCNCRAADKVEISSSCVKKLGISGRINFPGAEIDIPNLLQLDFSVTGPCNSRSMFSSWNVPKVEEVHMGFSVQSFRAVCRAGLKGFLTKLPNYQNLQLLIARRGLQMKNIIMVEKLHAVSFSSLNKFLKKAMPEYIIISSTRVENLLHHMLSFSSPVCLSLIFSSRQSIEMVYRKLSSDKTMQFAFSDFRLVSTEEIEHEMDSVWKSFVKILSTGYQTATIILSGQGWLGDGV